jgi:hypothetical protein
MLRCGQDAAPIEAPGIVALARKRAAFLDRCVFFGQTNHSLGIFWCLPYDDRITPLVVSMAELLL